MQLNVKLNFKPFDVPNTVSVTGLETDVDSSIPLKNLEPAALAQLCKEFTANVYKVAGKQAPARTRSISAAPLSSKKDTTKK